MLRKVHSARSFACRFDRRLVAVTCVLLILLLGKYRENSKLRVSSQMSSSQTFLPRSSKMGREQKSSCHVLAVGALLAPAAA